MTAHLCKGPLCGAPLGARDRAFCRDCWEKLPYELQRALWHAFRDMHHHVKGADDAYHHAVHKGEKLLGTLPHRAVVA